MSTRPVGGDSLFSLIIGPMVWVAHFLIVYITAALACAKDFFDLTVFGVGIVPLIVAVVTTAAAGLILNGAVMALRRWRGPRADVPLPPHDRADRHSRRRFMAYASLLLCGLSLVAVVWEALPVWFMTSCR